MPRAGFEPRDPHNGIKPNVLPIEPLRRLMNQGGGAWRVTLKFWIYPTPLKTSRSRHAFFFWNSPLPP